MYDIIIVGSGPNSLLFTFYFTLYYPNVKILIITKNFKRFHCTYGCFLDQIKNSWFFDKIKNTKNIYKTFKTSVHCPENNEKLINNFTNTIKTVNYLLFNNSIFFNFLKTNIVKSKNVKIIEGEVTDIKKNQIFYIKNNTIYIEKSKLIVESLGSIRPYGIEYYKYKNRYQIFYGLKIKCKFELKKIILLDWYDPILDDNITSFCYIIPISKNVLFFEETILITDEINNDLYIKLKNRLYKRLKDYEIEIQKILYEEKNCIVLNRGIPKYNSLSLGIGPCGNMMNTLSGYSLGYNIYHIPELVNLIIKKNYNLEQIYKGYWNNNWYRLFIYYINNIGSNMMLSFNQKNFSLFHKSFFEHYNEFIFSSIFLNCDNEKNIFKFISNSFIFLNYPKSILFKILRYIFT